MPFATNAEAANRLYKRTSDRIRVTHFTAWARIQIRPQDMRYFLAKTTAPTAEIDQANRYNQKANTLVKITLRFTIRKYPKLTELPEEHFEPGYNGSGAVNARRFKLKTVNHYVVKTKHIYINPQKYLTQIPYEATTDSMKPTDPNHANLRIRGYDKIIRCRFPPFTAIFDPDSTADIPLFNAPGVQIAHVNIEGSGDYDNDLVVYRGYGYETKFYDAGEPRYKASFNFN